MLVLSDFIICHIYLLKIQMCVSVCEFAQSLLSRLSCCSLFECLGMHWCHSVRYFLSDHFSISNQSKVYYCQLELYNHELYSILQLVTLAKVMSLQKLPLLLDLLCHLSWFIQGSFETTFCIFDGVVVFIFYTILTCNLSTTWYCKSSNMLLINIYEIHPQNYTTSTP